MNDFEDQVHGIADQWPDEGYVVGVLPDRSDPEWSGRSVLELIEAADRTGGPSVVVDLAPEATDLASRFEAGHGPGLSELATGEVELWEISHRSDAHRAVYLSPGTDASGSDLAGTGTLSDLAGQMGGRGRLTLVVLDRPGAEAAASAGYLDGFVRIGDADGADEHEDVAELGRITGRPAGQAPSPRTGEGPRLVLPPEMRSSHRRKERIRRGLLGLAALVALALVASSLLGGPGIDDLFSDSGERSGAVVRESGRQGGPSPAAAAASDSPSTVASGGDTAEAEATDTATAPSAAGPADSAVASVTDDGASSDGDQAGTTTESAADTAGAAPAATPMEVSPQSAGPPEFRAAADSIALSVREFSRQAALFRAGDVGCGALIEARRRVDRLFERLWLERMSLQPAADSPAAATYRERSRQVETVESTYEATSCPEQAFEGA